MAADGAGAFSGVRAGGIVAEGFRVGVIVGVLVGVAVGLGVLVGVRVGVKVGVATCFVFPPQVPIDQRPSALSRATASSYW